MYPNIRTVLELLHVIPVTTATVERANSSLKYIKTNLRSRMLSSRLNALLLLYIHKDVPLDYDEIVDSYAYSHPRRMILSRPLLAENANNEDDQTDSDEKD